MPLVSRIVFNGFATALRGQLGAQDPWRLGQCDANIFEDRCKDNSGPVRHPGCVSAGFSDILHCRQIERRTPGIDGEET